MGYDRYPSRQQAQSDRPVLSIIEPVVPEGNARPGKHQFSVGEIQAVLGKIAAVLRAVPFLLHPLL
jgi:hypothetical protein